jgi:hypothetical protein
MLFTVALHVSLRVCLHQLLPVNIQDFEPPLITHSNSTNCVSATAVRTALPCRHQTYTNVAPMTLTIWARADAHFCQLCLQLLTEPRPRPAHTAHCCGPCDRILPADSTSCNLLYACWSLLAAFAGTVSSTSSGGLRIAGWSLLTATAAVVIALQSCCRRCCCVASW